jgi:uncharacterized repeat protein (TIGR03803 family)
MRSSALNSECSSIPSASRTMVALCAVFLILLATPVSGAAQTSATSSYTNLIDLSQTDAAGTGPLIQGPDGNLYGFAAGSSTSGIPICNTNCGSILKVTPQGGVSKVYDFCSQPNCTDGVFPQGSVVLGTDGSFYGTTLKGGSLGGGTVFKITPEGSLTTLFNFCPLSCADGNNPETALVEGSDGNFYGTTVGGTTGLGTIFKITSQGQLTTIHTFCSQPNCKDGATPLGALVEGGDGNFYGTTSDVSLSGQLGTIFKMTPTGTLTTLHTFTGLSGTGAIPTGALTLNKDGNFYGTTSEGGGQNCDSALGGCGTVFRVTPAGKLTTIHQFCAKGTPCTDGSAPFGLTRGSDGKFYGASMGDPTNLFSLFPGTLFQITSSGTFTLLHSFCGEIGCTTGDGSLPFGSPVEGTSGNFYGTTFQGGNLGCSTTNLGCGVVYEFAEALKPFVAFGKPTGKAGGTVNILGQGLTGAAKITFNGAAATFVVDSDTELTATVPAGATSGLVKVKTPTATLTSNTQFLVIQ